MCVNEGFVVLVIRFLISLTVTAHSVVDVADFNDASEVLWSKMFHFYINQTFTGVPCILYTPQETKLSFELRTSDESGGQERKLVAASLDQTNEIPT